MLHPECRHGQTGQLAKAGGWCTGQVSMDRNKRDCQAETEGTVMKRYGEERVQIYEEPGVTMGWSATVALKPAEEI